MRMKCCAPIIAYLQRISRFLDAIASLVLTYDDDLDINDNININEYLDIDDDFDKDIEDNINLKTMKSLNIVWKSPLTLRNQKTLGSA